MEYIGRMVEVLLCIICLTLVPAGNMLKICEQQKENVLQVHMERFYAKIRGERCLTKQAYGHWKETVGQYGANTTFELMVARKYVMPAQQEGGAGYGMPVKILYRAEIEEMLLAEGMILLDGTVFINISVYSGEELLCSCGGGIW